MKSHEIDSAYGQQGPCLLRDLIHFNIGQSCATDSLHNIYGGTFVRTPRSVYTFLRFLSNFIETSIRIMVQKSWSIIFHS